MHWLARNAWWALIGFAAFSTLVGLMDLQAGAPDNGLAVAGMTNDQLAALNRHAYALMQDQIREGAIQLVILSVLSAAVVIFAFRRGQRWSWWALWILPLFAASEALLHLTDTAADHMPPVEVFTGAIAAVVVAAILLVSAPRFFRQQSGQ